MLRLAAIRGAANSPPIRSQIRRVHHVRLTGLGWAAAAHAMNGGLLLPEQHQIASHAPAGWRVSRRRPG
jgi:hypothetical protein